ncbi:serine/threonine-protein kinase PKH3-like [Lolium rigidum]|uniref:serine/threonine-protein kinase PKH3-like n=1 Tax=Lolium rigidum TaxID=89674 RepID=UPI001F5E009A|nr:serine/threonine-protein kinase PKH3-like [Lolium rigidum]
MERMIGTGAFGTVYLGTMQDGEMIAVKKLAENVHVARDEGFTYEAKNILSLKHENVVHFVGICYGMYKEVAQHNGRYITADIVEISLCYEYLRQGSLQKNLFDFPSRIGWDTRFKIIKGICQGLCFLHSIPIVHMHLKPENILLDNNMRPKIADFGLSRLFGQELVRMHTQNVVGSYGYIAPEYLYRGEISTKSDIYSLGLLILETTIGERHILKQKEPSARDFIENVRQKWTLEHISWKHPFLDSDGLLQVRTCIEIGLECVQIDWRKRPSIEQIIEKIDRLPQISSDSVLSLQPRRINFPIKPKRLTSSSLYLVNKTDDPIAFNVVTKIPKKYRTKLPFCGIVLPKCTYTLNVITPEQRKAPPLDNDDSLTLQSSKALHDHEVLENVDTASVAVLLDTVGDEVQEMKVVVACEPLAETVSNQIIDGQNYREVLSLDVHPTEPWILTSNKKGYVCIWNYQTQADVESTEVTREPVYSGKFIEREEWFVVGSGNGSIYVFDYNTMEEVDEIEAHDGHGIMCLAVNPTSSCVLSASDDHTIKLWDWTNEWKCTQTFEGHDDAVIQVIFDPRNSESFASVSLDRTIKIWNINSGTCNITLDGHQDGLLCVHYHPHYFKQFLVSGSLDGAAKVLHNLSAGYCIHAWILKCCFTFLLNKVWDLETDSCVDTLQEHTKDLSALCWHPELRVLVTGSFDGTVRIWKWKSTSSTYRLENIIALNLGAVHALGYLKGLTRIVVGCDQGISLMDINVV